MAKKNFIDDISVNTIVGPGALISGNITVSGFLRIDGDIDGNIQTQGRVIIGEEARIRGNIRATMMLSCTDFALQPASKPALRKRKKSILTGRLCIHPLFLIQNKGERWETR